MENMVVTGHKGFIGSHLFDQTGGIGIDVRDGLNVLSCDLPETSLVYHLAAQTSVESSWQDPVHDMDNIRMMARLVKEYPKTRIIYASSAAAQDPRSPYGFSKWMCAEYLKRFHTNYVICVFPNVYGPGSHSVVDAFKGQDTVTIYGSGRHKRDYVHVDDIVDGLIKAKDWDVGEYFMGSGIATSVLQLAEGKYVNFQEPRKEAKESVLFNSTPNWKPTISVMEYLYAEN